MHTMSLAEDMYAAYNAGGDPATANKNFRGDPCPAWADLPANIRAKWEASAACAIEAVAMPPDEDAPLAPSFDFGLAIVALKAGKRVRRAGWNGKGMWLALTDGSERVVRESKFNGAAAQFVAVEAPEVVRIGAHIDMRAADGSLVIGWLASQTDMLANDWEVVL